MDRIKRIISRVPFSRQMAAVICLFALLPMLAFCGYMLQTMRSVSVETRAQEARTRSEEITAQVEKAVELCNMSTQVFLNTPALTGHLIKLKNGTPIPSTELLEFYDNDIASLEKIVVSNPYLYQIRVYSVREDISEMLPILFSAQRMRRMPWSQAAVASGSWQMDFDDQLYDGYAVTHHIMSLVTEITTPAAGQVGTLEVAVRMDDLLPELFADDPTSSACLLDGDGQVLVGDSTLQADAAQLTAAGYGVTTGKLAGQEVLCTWLELPGLGVSYLQATSLAAIGQQASQRAIWVFLALATVFLALIVLVNGLCNRMLRQFYEAFGAVSRFAQGDLNASVAVSDPESEVGRFAGGINTMLDRIRQLMQDNVTRELLGKNAELRALQNQINAHFIYNVLEAIKMMAEIDEEYEIADAITNLGKLLRYGLRWTSKSATLEQEVENVRNYLALMNLRFDYTLTLQLELPDCLLPQSIPKMSLQPIVENAVVHGLEEVQADTAIVLRGTVEPDGGACRIEIIDHGKGMTPEVLHHLEQQIAGEVESSGGSGNGLGLKNVQDRIHMMFGEAYRLTVSSEQNRYTKVTVRLPYHSEGERYENHIGG